MAAFAKSDRRQLTLARRRTPLRGRAKLQSRLSQAWHQIENERRQVLTTARRQAEDELEDVRRRLTRAIAMAEAGAVPGNSCERPTRKCRRYVTTSPRSNARLAPEMPEEFAEAGDGGRALAVGQTVWIESLQQHGEVLTLPDARGEAEVQLGALKTRVPASEIQPRRAGERPSRATTMPPPVFLPVMHEAPPLEVDLRGMRAEEALEVLDKYLEDAYLTGYPSSVLFTARALASCARWSGSTSAGTRWCASLQTADPREGGEGATIAKAGQLRPNQSHYPVIKGDQPECPTT